MTNKNFIVKHGIEVDGNLIYANPDTNKVGIGTTTPIVELDVSGDIRTNNIEISQTLSLNGNVEINGDSGSLGYYISNTGTGVTWAPIPGLRNILSVSANVNQSLFNAVYNVSTGVDVFINGTRLSSTDYIANDGATVVLTVPCFGGEKVDIISYSVFGNSSGLTIQDNSVGVGSLNTINSINFVGFSSVSLSQNGLGVSVVNSIGDVSVVSVKDELRFYEDAPSCSDYISLSAPGILTSTTQYTLPSRYPEVNGYLLSSNTLGILTWTPPTSGGGGGGLSVYDEGVQIGSNNQFSNLNIVGQYVSASGVGSTATITVSPITNYSLVAGVSTNVGLGSTGNVLYQSGPGITSFVPNGSNNQVLTFNGSIPVWSTFSGGGAFVYVNTNNITSVNLTSHPDITTATNNLFAGSNAGLSITTGSNNIFIGDGAGEETTQGYNNVFLGLNAGNSNLGGHNNVFIGEEAGFANNTGNRNVFIGLTAGLSNLSGLRNVFIGPEAGYSIVDGTDNIFIGSGSGYYNTSNSGNIFIGPDAGYGNEDTPLAGDDNIFLGRYAGFVAANANNNIFMGNSAGENFESGDDNLIFGNLAGRDATGGNENIFLGKNTGQNNISGSNNIFMGTDVGNSNDIGGYNVFFGYQAGGSNTSGNYNIFIGDNAGNANTSGVDNVFIGSYAGAGISGGGSGGNNVFLGPSAGIFNDTGSNNVFIGEKAGYSNTDGINNIFIGKNSGWINTNGENNVYLGLDAGGGNATGSFNVCMGYRAGDQTTGSSNIFIGPDAGRNNSGNNNIYIGNAGGSGGTYNVSLGIDAGGSTSGNSNIFMGFEAGEYNTTGASNIFLGNRSGRFNESGQSNNYVGSVTGYNNLSGQYNTYLGTASGISTNSSRKIVIGHGINETSLFDTPNPNKDLQLAVGMKTDSNPSKYWIVGDENFNVGIGTTITTSKLTVGGDVAITGVATIGLGTTSNPSFNSSLTFELPSDTSLVIKVRGSDGVLRSATITLS